MLRGCIGTFHKISLRKNLPLYSLISAFDDSRFKPISFPEIPYLHCTVSLLSQFERINDPYDWIIGKHGIQVKASYNSQIYTATFLPEVTSEQGWGKKETLIELLRKAEYPGTLQNAKSTLEVERYQSDLYSANYSDYVDFIKRNKEAFKLSDKSLNDNEIF